MNSEFSTENIVLIFTPQRLFQKLSIKIPAAITTSSHVCDNMHTGVKCLPESLTWASSELHWLFNRHRAELPH